MLYFILILMIDLKSHTGDALACAFHKMLVEHGLEHKVSHSEKQLNTILV